MAGGDVNQLIYIGPTYDGLFTPNICLFLVHGEICVILNAVFPNSVSCASHLSSGLLNFLKKPESW